jgi:hypothetical protein
MANYYEFGKIYKIECNITKRQYIGSTTQLLESRLKGHWNNYLSTIQNRSKRPCSSFEILKGNDFAIHLIENVKCKNKEELLTRERFYIETTDCVNKNKPILTREESKNYITHYYTHYYCNNKAVLATKHKEYYDEKRSQILEWQKKNYEENKKEIQQKRKEYYENNKAKIQQQKKEYYLKKKQERGNV